ncbi:unnamed protein product [Diatraea saccharalis]|uniref:Uncharacterized protein n=1 Tax=Diatraea saccharalis TaxID=40085 RepID=A0A9N9R3Y0_9NEOP|nr:unnamed protein product [Diatraea saccharalis]
MVRSPQWESCKCYFAKLGSEVSPYGPLWDAPPAPVPYPDILAFPPADLVWSAAGCGGRAGSRAPPGGKKPRRRVASVAQRRAANILLTTVTPALKDESRPKRDIALIKNFIMRKLFHGGEVQNTVSQPNYRLFRIPGFDNILVKAIPKGNIAANASSVIESDIEEHPSIALVKSYLGTKSLGETLSALEGTKTLLQSGILKAREATDVSYNTYRVPVNISPTLTETFEVIDLDDEQSDCKVPSLQQRVPIPYASTLGNMYKPARIPIPDLAYPTKYSYKQIHGDGVTSYTSKDNKNVIVTESKNPVHLPGYLRSRLQEVLSTGPIPLNAVHYMHSFKPPVYNIPVKHLHQDGSVTTYSGSSSLEESQNQKESLTGQAMSYQSSVSFNPYDPSKLIVSPHMPLQSAFVPTDYYYKQMHENGSVTTYSGSDAVEKRKNQNPFLTGQAMSYQSSLSFNPYDTPKLMGTSHIPMQPAIVPTDYSYKHLHKDGSITTYSESGAVEEPKNQNQFLTGQAMSYQSSVMFNPHDPPKIKGDSHIPTHPVFVPNDYSYKHLHKDGSVTTYSGGGAVEDIKSQKESLPVQASSYQSSLLYNPYDAPKSIVAPHVLTDYSYNHLHKDGSVITYPVLGEVEKSKNQKDSFPVQAMTYQSSLLYNPYVPPNLIVAPHLPIQSALVPTDYSYKHLHQNGSVTTYSGSGAVEESKNPKSVSYQSSLLFNHPDTPKLIVDPHIPAQPEFVPTDYSYKHLHQDGSVTTYSGSGDVEESKNQKSSFPVQPFSHQPSSVVNIHEPHKLIVAPHVPVQPVFVPIDDARPGNKPAIHVTSFETSPFVNIYDAPYVTTNTSNYMSPKVSAKPTDYSYKHVHNDGVVTIYNGADVVENSNGKPYVIVNEVRRPIPLPSFPANVPEAIYRDTSPMVVEKAVYGPPLPVYKEQYPILFEHIPGPNANPLNPFSSDEIKKEYNSNSPLEHFYQKIHKGDTSVNFESGFHTNESDEEKATETMKDNHQSDHYNSVYLTSRNAIDKVLNNSQNNTQVKDDSSQTGVFSYTTVHSDGSKTPYFDSGKEEEDKTEDIKKSPASEKKPLSVIINRESDKSQEVSSRKPVRKYRKRVNHRTTRRPTTIGSEDANKKYAPLNEKEDITNNNHIISVNKKSESSIVSKKRVNKFSTIKPSMSTSTELEPEKSVTRVSFKQTTNHGVHTNKNGAVDIKTETPLSYNKDSSDVFTDYYTTDATLSSSDISLNTNPIVVLSDEEDLTVMENKLSILEENGPNFEFHRGDIPESSYRK